jgi:hypothetical protein
MTGTVEENILFGLPLNQSRLEKVIEVCALRTDVEQLPMGLQTEVGRQCLAKVLDEEVLYNRQTGRQAGRQAGSSFY